jgi:hypothetical protein
MWPRSKAVLTRTLPHGHSIDTAIRNFNVGNFFLLPKYY